MRFIFYQTQDSSPSLRSYLFRLDMPFLAISALLLTAGSFCVYLALQHHPDFDALWLRHVTAWTLAVGIAAILSLLPAAHFGELSRFLYAFAVLLLVLVLAFGRTIHGSRSWFVLGPVQFQPSELAKLATILFVSHLIVVLRQKDPALMAGSRLKIFIIMALPVVLVLMQRDLSSTAGFFFIALAYFWGLEWMSTRAVLGVLVYAIFVFLFLVLHILAGFTGVAEAEIWSRRLQSLGFGPGFELWKLNLWLVSAAALAWAVYRLLKGIYVLPRFTTWRWALSFFLVLASILAVSWGLNHTFKNYQKNRLISFVMPRADPLGSGYNITQSKIAIGSGRMFGRGFGLGSQTALGFLPENHTDFAFSTLAEMTGFVGAAGLLILMGSLLWRMTRFLELARDDFGKLVSLGLWGLWLGEISLNIACVLGLFPVLGIGLPFISYGGSRLVVNGISLGILLSISRGFYVYR